MEEEIYTLAEAAAIVGCAPRSLENRIKDQKLEATGSSTSTYRITKAALEKYLAYRARYPYGHKYVYTDEL